MYDCFYYRDNLQQVKKQASTAKTEFAWILHEDVDYSSFDLRFVPNRFEKNQCHVWGSHNNANSHTTWLVPVGVVNPVVNYHNEMLPSIHPPIIMWPDFNEAILTGNDWYDSLCNWLKTQDLPKGWFWVCDNRINYSDFEFNWLPDGWDHSYIHCFALKGYKQLSYTWLVHADLLQNPQYKFHNSDLGFSKVHIDTVLLDMGTGRNDYLYSKKIRFTGNMHDVLTSSIRKSTHEWLRVISNCCSYHNYDFSWLPELDQINQTHCWPSGTCIKGETFLIHVPSYLRTGEFYFNFDHTPVKRLAWPTIAYEQDSLAKALNQSTRLPSVYTLYYKLDAHVYRYPEPCLWEKRPVIGMNKGNSATLVPRDCVVKDEIYEYDYLEKQHDSATSANIDIIFIHNGEKSALENLEQLMTCVPDTMEVKISSGVNGRLKAYKAAAELSTSDWFLAVFAKCFMLDDFVRFNWRPDYWQKPKHYIFYNYNYDLDLTYGHMAPIAYNKNLMLENTGGLDMTLAQEHAVVPVVLSETRLQDDWETWRTSFRETLKLLYYSSQTNSIELDYRLHKWLTAESVWTKHNPWYQIGAKDAVEFFESTDGSLHWILLSNEWVWLWDRYKSLHK